MPTQLSFGWCLCIFSLFFPPHHIKGVLEPSRAEYQTMSWCVSAWLLLLVTPLCVPLTTAITNYCPRGERHPLLDLPFCLFTSPLVSLSCYSLRLLMCVWGVSLLTSLAGEKKGHALVSSISRHLYLSLRQDSGRLANQIPSFIHFLT